MRWWFPVVAFLALGAAGFHYLSKPIVPEAQCANRSPEELEQAVVRHMKNRTSWFLPPHRVATPFLQQHRFLRNEYGYSPDPRSWIVPFTVGEGASTSLNTMIAIVHCSGYVELSFWRPSPESIEGQPASGLAPSDRTLLSSLLGRLLFAEGLHNR